MRAHKNGSSSNSVHCSASNAVTQLKYATELRNGIMLDFYPGLAQLPHVPSLEVESASSQLYSGSLLQSAVNRHKPRTIKSPQ